MNSQTNYEEDLFLLKNLIRYWTDALAIPADPEYFSEKLLDDLDYIEAILARLQETLQENTNLIHRKEIIHDLLTTRILFRKLLSQIISPTTPLASSLAGHKSKVASILAGQDVQSDALDRELRQKGSSDEGEEDLITPMEMEFLLKREAEEDPVKAKGKGHL